MTFEEWYKRIGANEPVTFKECWQQAQKEAVKEAVEILYNECSLLEESGLRKLRARFGIDDI